MPITKPDFDSVDERDLQELVTSGTTESETLDFKRETYGGSDADKKELLKDVSAFANVRGGHLVIGVDDVEGVASSVPGITVPDMDAEARRIDSILAAGIEPRIVGLRIKPIRLQSGRACIVVRVPPSWHQPHRVAFSRSNKFFIRRSLSVDEASMNELRELFGRAANATDRFRAFHLSRINEIVAAEIRPLEPSGRFVLHIAPLASVVGDYMLDLRGVDAQQHSFAPIASAGYSPGYNFDGFILQRGGERNLGYTQVFRNGVVEAAWGGIINTRRGYPVIPGAHFEKELVKATVLYLRALQQLEVPVPLLIVASLEGVRSAFYAVRENALWIDGPPAFTRDFLTLPMSVLENYGSDADHRAVLIPALNALWNAMSYERDEYFSPDGTTFNAR